MTFLEIIGNPFVWIPIAGVLGVLAWLNFRKRKVVFGTIPYEDGVLLELEIPRTNDKKELAAEQMFASLHGILRESDEAKSTAIQEYISLEIAFVNGRIKFFVWTPKLLKNFVESQIYSQYPTVQIHPADEDYAAGNNLPVAYETELALTDSEFLPIRTFESFDVDPLAGITGVMAKLDGNGERSEQMWVQVLVRPIADSWHKKSAAWVKDVKKGVKTGFNPDTKWWKQVLFALWKPPEADATKPELSDRDKTRVAKAEEKATKLGYQVKIRLVYAGPDQETAKLNMQALVGTFKQYNSTNLNGFKSAAGSFEAAKIEEYKGRQFADKGFILNISELASLYHLPHTSVETPNVAWATSKTAEPPSKLPIMTGDPKVDESISAFGLTNFRGINHQFGMLRRDRSRHVYAIGQTGAGKSGLLELFALSDVFHDQGYAIIDPHGDFAVNNMRFIPERRMKDVVYFNPADTKFPVAFNPMEVTDPSRKPNISSEIIGVLKRMFGESWGPRLEYILRYTILALLDRPGTTMLDITRFLTERDYRKETLEYCKDITVLQFWKVEFGQWSDKQVTEGIAPVLNKVGAFVANPIIRNIIGQPKSAFNIRKIMDEGKILIVNLSKGLIGEDNAGILGAFLVTKVQLAAMSRSDIANVDDRKQFYLYVDEFQNFATDSFATILSEARKYGLNLTVANQYVSQMQPTVRDAVFGNVGTTISFRVSADDAPILAKQFEPTFEAADLIQMNNRHFVISMIVNGEKMPAFSATTLNLPSARAESDHTDAIVANSRELFARPREDVEKDIAAVLESAGKFQGNLAEQGRVGNEQGSEAKNRFDAIREFKRSAPSAAAQFAVGIAPAKEQTPQAAQAQPAASYQGASAAAAAAAQPEQKPSGINQLKNLKDMIATSGTSPSKSTPAASDKKYRGNKRRGGYRKG